MSGLAKILLVEDDASLAQQLKWFLKREHEVAIASTQEGVRRFLREQEFQVMLLDLGLPPHPEDPTVGLKVLQEVTTQYPALKVIVLTAHGEQQIAREALSRGAYDFLVKPVDESLLNTLIKRAFYRRELEAEYREGQEQGLPVPMVIASEKMHAVIKTTREVAALPISCIILGETGTGKELIAQLLHHFSPRKHRPLVVVECPSIPVTLGEAELFGAEKGSYTGSVGRREGRIAQAEGGTLFLDEVGELSLELQTKLLRFLETKEYTPIAGKTAKADVRIIAATNRTLTEEVERGRVRLDLYHRLCQVEITVPPLRERQEEIIPLARHFLAKLSHEFRMPPCSLALDAERALVRYPFPGNVRELKNMIARAMVVSHGAPIGAKELGLGEAAAVTEVEVPSGFDLPQAKTNLERHWVEEALRRHDGKVAQAAADLGIPRPTLYDLMKKHGIGEGEKAEGRET